MGQEREVV